MNEQPEALRLAERLVGMEASSNDQYEAAAELRRLHEENVYLRDVYESLVQDRNELFDDLDKAVAAEREACAKICDGWASYGVPAVAAAAQAIRARGEQEQSR